MNKRSLISLISLSCILLSSPAFGVTWRSAWDSTTGFVGDLPGCLVKGFKTLGCLAKNGGECFVAGLETVGCAVANTAVCCGKGVANIPVKNIASSIKNGAVTGFNYIHDLPVKSVGGAAVKVGLPTTAIVGLVCWKLWNRKPEPVALTNVTRVEGVGSLLTQTTPSK